MSTHAPHPTEHTAISSASEPAAVSSPSYTYMPWRQRMPRVGGQQRLPRGSNGQSL